MLSAKDWRFIKNLSTVNQDPKKRCSTVRRSKLESYEAILETLVKKPLTVDRIAYETTMDCTVLNRRLNFLMENGLVEERPLSEKTLYAITERGIAVFKTLNFNRYVEKISNTLSAIDEALQAIPVISKDYEETEETR
jgi:predicted transcriptional regulator